MSAIIGSGQNLYRTNASGVLNHASAYTWMAWFKSTTSGVWQGLLSYYASDSLWETAEIQSNNTWFAGTNSNNSGGGTFSANTWYHVALVRSGSTVYLHLNGAAALLTINVGADTMSPEMVMGDWKHTGSDQFIGRISYARAFTTALTAAQITAEKNSTTPVITASLWGDWPLQSNGNDTSGNGRNWSASGSVTYNTIDEPIAGSLTGTLSKTLDTATLSSTSKVALKAILGRTLAAATLGATGELAPIAGSGTLSATLDAATIAAAGKVALRAILTATLGDLQSSAAGHLAVHGSLTSTLAAATLDANNNNFNYNILVGDGYSDVSPKQIVRTSGNRVYIGIPYCGTYPDFTTNGLDQSLRIFRADSTGVPTGFTRKDSSNEPTAIMGNAIAIDGSDVIHVVWAARSSSNLTHYLRYAQFNTSTDTWGSVTTIASDLDYDDIGQGDQSVALALDASGNCHVVYLGTAGSGILSNRRVYYRNNVGGSWSSATQIDTGVTYTGSYKAWHPNIAFDTGGNILVVWAVGQFNGSGDTTIYSRIYTGSWGSTVQASAETTLETGIDQSTSILITSDNTYYLTYILHSTTNSQKYIRCRVSTNGGVSWSSNSPINQATHNPVLGLAGNKVRIFGHGTPDASNHGENLYYFELSGGNWGSWTQFAAGTNYDSSINTRWSQYFFNHPDWLDIVYWNDNYPNVAYAGSAQFELAATVGIVDATLATLTATAVGDLQLAASVAQTLAAATSTAVGAIALRGATSVALSGVILASTATLEATGSAVGVLDDLAIGSTAVLRITAEVSSTLDPTTASGLGTLALLATSSNMLDMLDVSAVGFVGNAPAIGQLSATLSNAAMVAAGLLSLQASASNLLESLGITGQATLDLQGAAFSLLGDVQVIAIGILTLQGDLAITLDSVIIQAAGSTGWNTLTGAADITLADLASASAGQLAVVGGVTATLHPLELTTAGALAIRGTSTVTLENATLIADNLASAVVMIVATLYGPAVSHGNLGINTESTLVGPGN